MDETPKATETKPDPEMDLSIRGFRRTFLYWAGSTFIASGFLAYMTSVEGYSDRQFWAACAGASVGMAVFAALSPYRWMTPLIGITAWHFVAQDTDDLFLRTSFTMAGAGLFVAILFWVIYIIQRVFKLRFK